MIRLPKRILFSIKAVLAIACHTGGSPARSIDITEREGIPTRYLEPVLQQLVSEGILVGIRGPAGGYRLALAPDKIKLGDVVRVVEGSKNRDETTDDSRGYGLGGQVVHLLWVDLQKEMMRRLDAISIEDLRAKAMRPVTKARSTERRARRVSA